MKQGVVVARLPNNQTTSSWKSLWRGCRHYITFLSPLLHLFQTSAATFRRVILDKSCSLLLLFFFQTFLAISGQGPQPIIRRPLLNCRVWCLPYKGYTQSLLYIEYLNINILYIQVVYPGCISRFTLGWSGLEVYSILEATFCLSSRKWFSHRTLKSKRMESMEAERASDKVWITVGKRFFQQNLKSGTRQYTSMIILELYVYRPSESPYQQCKIKRCWPIWKALTS